jgi:hypothetical protein
MRDYVLIIFKECTIYVAIARWQLWSINIAALPLPDFQQSLQIFFIAIAPSSYISPLLASFL